jgi:hypothetical protein
MASSSLRSLLLVVALLAALAAPARGDCRNSTIISDPNGFPGIPAVPTIPGLPSTVPPVVVEIFMCGRYAQQLQSGNVPPALCEPDTLPTVRRCIDVGVQLGVISQAQAKVLNASLTASCRLPRPG